MWGAQVRRRFSRAGVCPGSARVLFAKHKYPTYAAHGIALSKRSSYSGRPAINNAREGNKFSRQTQNRTYAIMPDAHN